MAFEFNPQSRFDSTLELITHPGKKINYDSWPDSIETPMIIF